MVGTPGSGKDTWVDKFLSLDSGKDYTMVSTDAILERMALQNGMDYNEAFRLFMKDAEREFNETIDQLISENKNVVWNQTNMGLKKRKKILRRFNSYIAVAVVITIDHNVLMDRLEQREKRTGKYISPSVITQMLDSYSEPSTEEGFESVMVLDNSGSEFSLIKLENAH
jgi:predicted kinase